MEEMNRFVVLAQSGRFSVTDLCEQFGISRKTGYKHLERYASIMPLDVITSVSELIHEVSSQSARRVVRVDM